MQPRNQGIHILFTFLNIPFPLFSSSWKWNLRVEIYMKILLINNECSKRTFENIASARKEISANKAREVNSRWIIYFQYCMHTFPEIYDTSWCFYVQQNFFKPNSKSFSFSSTLVPFLPSFGEQSSSSTQNLQTVIIIELQSSDQN